MDWKTQSGYAQSSFNEALMCQKCILASALGVIGLNYAGLTNGVTTADPSTFIKPFFVLFGSSVVADFLMMEYDGYKGPVAKK